MQVLILAAGYGTRLYPVIKNTSKSLLDVNGSPLIDYTLDKVKGLPGLSKVFVVTNDKFFEDFQRWASGHNNFGAEIKIINDGSTSPDDRLGSIGDIAFSLKHESIADDLLVVGGDNLFDYELTKFHQFAAAKIPSVTVGLFDIQNLKEAKEFGVAALDPEGKISSFEEKPNTPKSSLIAMCLYCFPKESLELLAQYLSQSEKTDKAGDYIHWLCRQQPVYGYQFKGRWFDIGSIESYKEAQKAFSSLKK